MKGGVNYIAMAIPVFFLLIGVELLLARLWKRPVYRLNDSLNDLSCGVLQQVLGAFLGASLIASYVYLYGEHRVLDMPTRTVWSWALLFVGVDFLYYWFHRASHEINFLWAAHVVHHQSEEYNLSVALRQGAFQPAFSWVFYLPLAILGFPPWMFGTVVSLNTLYQFWIHTQLIDRMGPLEWIINTPSHHRVHHGRNSKYIDRNHAGSLIIWDKLFGTFQVEEEAPTYGITQPLESWNPIWANFHYFAELVRASRQASRWSDKLKVWFAKPGWRPEGARPARVAELSEPKFDPSCSRGLGTYAALQFAPLVPATMFFLQMKHELSLELRLSMALFFAFTLFTLGGLLERRRWAAPAELLRLLSLAPLVAWMGAAFGAGVWLALGFGALTLGSGGWLLKYGLRELPGVRESAELAPR